MAPRRDAARVLLRIAFRNLLASPVRTGILGAIVLVGALIVVVGSSVLDSIDRGMRTSIQGSLGGHLQVYDARSEGALELYGGLRGESLLEPIEDFSRVKAVLGQVPNVKQVVPMGIDQALVATGNAFDLALERLRGDVRRLEGGEDGPELRRDYAAHAAHVRRMVQLLRDEIAQAREISDPEGREAAERKSEWEALQRAATDAFWRDLDRDRYGSLEFLENRVAPLAMDTAFTFLRYVGTDVDAFFRAFPLAEVVKGERIPTGQRGVLVGKQYAEEWLKLKNARRLDQIKDARDLRGRRIAGDEELQRWVRENRSGIREILLQLDPLRADALAQELRPALGAPAAEPLDALLGRLFAATDESFDRQYRIFYDVVAPKLRLYQIDVGDTITIKAPSKSGYFSSVNVKVYGFLQFKGIERSGIAGMMSVLDLMSFRDLYGYLTAEKAAEIRALQKSMGTREIDRERAEAELFGAADGGLVGEAHVAEIDEGALVKRREEERASAANLAAHVYSQEELEHGVALNAALILDDPRLLRRTEKDVRKAIADAGLGLKVVDWQEAAGLVGQFVTLLRVVLFTAVVIFFAIALVIINNAMVMATLQRVKEIGTMRAIGTQRRFVVTMLLVEIATVGLVFGLAGAALGGAVVWGIRAAGGIPAVTDLLYFVFSGPALFPRLGALAVGGSLAVVLLVAILSALYPALIAMRVTPVEAMATED
ncbi:MULTISPECIES: ABC transporter permease [Anaeromyxobacter]|uniref:ABC transporter permease n=1 Tax=Anaeromyxobacter TaxID=161492 RepID=UPI001F5AACC5|nr:MULTISPECIES: FtsX-like permease family protein [unclassified Anaeromyxobacter]